MIRLISLWPFPRHLHHLHISNTSPPCTAPVPADALERRHECICWWTMDQWCQRPQGRYPGLGGFLRWVDEQQVARWWYTYLSGKSRYPLAANIAGWNIPIFNRKCIFKGSIFQPAMLDYQRVYVMIALEHGVYLLTTGKLLVKICMCLAARQERHPTY